MLVTLKHRRILRGEHLGVDRGVDGALNLIWGWPDVAKVNVMAGLVLAQSLRLKVKVHGAGKGVSNHQWR